MHLQVVVFNLTTPGNIKRALVGDPEIGTTVSCEECGDKLGWDRSWSEFKEAAEGGAAA